VPSKVSRLDILLNKRGKKGNVGLIASRNVAGQKKWSRPIEGGKRKHKSESAGVGRGTTPLTSQRGSDLLRTIKTGRNVRRRRHAGNELALSDRDL